MQGFWAAVAFQSTYTDLTLYALWFFILILIAVVLLFSAESDTVSVGEPDLAADLAAEPVKVAAAPLDLPSPEEVRIFCSYR